MKLDIVAPKFKRSVAEMEEDVATLITEGRLAARIDTCKGIVTKRRVDVRAQTFEKVLAIGEQYTRDTKALALRISLTRHGVVIKAKQASKASSSSSSHLGRGRPSAGGS